MKGIRYDKLIEPTAEIAAAMARWENDPELVPLIRHCATKDDLTQEKVVTIEVIRERLRTREIYLIYFRGQLVGEINYQVDPAMCLQKVAGTAWIGIHIAEKSARHRGIGYDAMMYLESEMRLHGLKRIELGVFEFNENARRLYRNLGYKEIGRVEEFTYWKGKMWPDIRMEKEL
jgi:RimJ/RimL family protein N-acetyltransferase